MLPSLPEIESEPNISDSTSTSDSTSAINMNIDLPNEATDLPDEAKSEGEDITISKVQKVEITSSENASIIFENDGKPTKDDNNEEISGEINNTERREQSLSSDIADSTPDILVDKCSTKSTVNIQQRRMSKSCDQIHENIGPNNSKWNSWSSFFSTISNTVARVRYSLSSFPSNSVGTIDQVVDKEVDNQNDNYIPETCD